MSDRNGLEDGRSPIADFRLWIAEGYGRSSPINSQQTMGYGCFFTKTGRMRDGRSSPNNSQRIMGYGRSPTKTVQKRGLLHRCETNGNSIEIVDV